MPPHVKNLLHTHFPLPDLWREILSHYQRIATYLLNIHSIYLDNILLFMPVFSQ